MPQPICSISEEPSGRSDNASVICGSIHDAGESQSKACSFCWKRLSQYSLEAKGGGCGAIEKGMCYFLTADNS